MSKYPFKAGESFMTLFFMTQLPADVLYVAGGTKLDNQAEEEEDREKSGVV